MLNPCPLPMWHWRWNSRLHIRWTECLHRRRLLSPPGVVLDTHAVVVLRDPSVLVLLHNPSWLFESFHDAPCCVHSCDFPFASQMLCLLCCFHLWVLGFKPLISSFLCTQFLGNANVFLSHLFLWLTDLYSENTSLLCSVCACVYGLCCFWMTIKPSQIMF